MTDEEFAAKATRYRRRYVWVTVAFAVLGIAQLLNFLVGGSTVLGLIAGVAFLILAVANGVVAHRGLPDSR